MMSVPKTSESLVDQHRSKLSKKSRRDSTDSDETDYSKEKRIREVSTTTRE